MIWRALALLLVAAGPVAALDLSLPSNARQTVTRNTNPDAYSAPIGVFDGETVPMQVVEGAVDRAAWRIDSPGLTPVQVIRPLRAQMVDAGFEIVLDCAADACGGFDFRFATEILPGPNMYVNLRAFHMVTGLKGAGEVVTLLASTSATTAYVQIVHAGGGADEGLTVVPAAVPAPVVLAAPEPPEPVAELSFGERLRAEGHVVLADLDFASGSTDLGPGPFESLAVLRQFLEAEPEMRIALVGHTDTVGGLEANINVSRARARSVRQRLIESYGIAEERLDAEGMGYLAPVASNLTAEGRDQNRRVEVVLLGPA